MSTSIDTSAGLSGALPPQHTVGGKILRSPLGALSPITYLALMEGDARRNILNQLSAQQGMAGQRLSSRSAQAAAARGLTGGAAASSQQRVLTNFESQNALQNAAMQQQFLQQDVQGLAQIASLLVGAGGGGFSGAHTGLLQQILAMLQGQGAVAGASMGAGAGAGAGAGVGDNLQPADPVFSGVR